MKERKTRKTPKLVSRNAKIVWKVSELQKALSKMQMKRAEVLLLREGMKDAAT